jgi:hypothetical protein
MKNDMWIISFVFKSAGECLSLIAAALSVPVKINVFLFHTKNPNK